MKDKAPIIVLIIVAAGLGIALIVVNNKARREKQDLYDALSVQSNTVTTIKTSLAEQQAVNQVLETNLASTRAEYSNKLSLSDANLRSVEETLEKAKAESKAQSEADTAEISRRDKRISELENQNQDLDKQAGDLRDHIAGLQTQIDATKDKLARSQGDREALLKELKRLEADKLAWEDRFNDLAYLKVHINRIKAELADARALEFLRLADYGGSHKRGGERLVHPTNNPPTELTPTLNVELHQGGGSNGAAPSAGGVPPK